MAGDQATHFIDAVRSAAADKRQLTLVGEGSKAPAGSKAPFPACGDALAVAEHAGVEDYRPEELVLTARGGTPLADIQAELGQCRQELPFEPPMLEGKGTLGGAVATGWSGPGRPWRGAVRDAVLGVEMINGLGERLAFGGQVMKNVAGYDLSRLQTGAWGSLGILLSVSVRLNPQPQLERTCRLECGATEALAWMREWARRFSPISATCFDSGVLHVRLSGMAESVEVAASRIGGEQSQDPSLWQAIRDRALPIFRNADQGDAELWQINCAPAAELPTGPCLVEWGGARRWWRTDEPPSAVCAYAAEAGGVALPAGAAPSFQTPLMMRLKRAFDPDALFNPHLVDADALQ